MNVDDAAQLIRGAAASVSIEWERAGGTCDWGDCDELTERLRWDDGHGWLPVCYAHSLTDADRAVLDAAEQLRAAVTTLAPESKPVQAAIGHVVATAAARREAQR